jgi:hypothetical protein
LDRLAHESGQIVNIAVAFRRNRNIDRADHPTALLEEALFQSIIPPR